MRGPVRMHFVGNGKEKRKIVAIFVQPDDFFERICLYRRGYRDHMTNFGRVMQKGLGETAKLRGMA